MIDGQHVQTVPRKERMDERKMAELNAGTREGEGNTYWVFAESRLFFTQRSLTW